MPAPARSLDRATFLEQVAAGEVGGTCKPNFVPLWKRWPADLETPLTTWLKTGARSQHGVLLESVEGAKAAAKMILVGHLSSPIGKPSLCWGS